VQIARFFSTSSLSFRSSTGSKQAKESLYRTPLAVRNKVISRFHIQHSISSAGKFISVAIRYICTCLIWFLEAKMRKVITSLLHFMPRNCVRLGTVKTFFFFGSTAPIWGLGLPPWNSPFHFSFLDLRQSVELLGRVISSSQGLYLYTNTEKRTHTNIKHPCPEWNSNPRSRLPSERRQCIF
jgi:hypothetical protein